MPQENDHPTNDAVTEPVQAEVPADSSVPCVPHHQVHRVLIAIAMVAGLAELAYMLMNFSAMPVYLKYSMHYGEASVALIGTFFLLCEGVMKGPFGIIGDRIGRKHLIIIGPAISTVTSLVTLVIHPSQWYLFTVLRILDGLGAAALWPSALAMIADVVKEDRRSQAMSLFNVTYLVGVALGPFIGGAANDLTRIIMPSVDPRQASFYVISVIFLATTLVAYRKIPDVRPHHETAQADDEAAFALNDLIHNLRRIPQILAMAFVTYFGVGLIMLIIKLFAMAEYGISETQYGALLLVPALVIAAASVPLGTLGDRLGKAKAVRLGMGICAFSMWALVLLKSQLVLVVGGSLIGVGFVIAFPSWMAYVSSSCDKSQRGAIMGSVGTAQGLGAMLGAPFGGYLYEHGHIRISFLPWINAHYSPFIACATMLLIAWILAMTTVHDTPATS